MHKHVPLRAVPASAQGEDPKCKKTRALNVLLGKLSLIWQLSMKRGHCHSSLRWDSVTLQVTLSLTPHRCAVRYDCVLRWLACQSLQRTTSPLPQAARSGYLMIHEYTDKQKLTTYLFKDIEAMLFGTWLEHYYFQKYILDVSIATLEWGGVTSQLDTYQFLTPIDAWAVPKYPKKTAILAPGTNIADELVQFIHANETFLREPDTWLGTWISPLTYHCHLDITIICSCLEDAKQEAAMRSQQEGSEILAVYNFKHRQTVYLASETSLSSPVSA
jgi:hypothetical protein